jgi:hypothetical protein
VLAVTTTTWSTLGTLATAVFSAVAAGAAWAAVRQTAFLNREARRPLLHLSTTGTAATGTMHAHIRNGGGGVAREVMIFLMFEGRPEAILGALPPEGMLAPGAAIRLELPWSLADVGRRLALGAVVCTDTHGDLFSWTGGGASRHWRARRLKRHPVSNLEVVRSFFPDAPDPEQMVPATWVSWEAA